MTNQAPFTFADARALIQKRVFAEKISLLKSPDQKIEWVGQKIASELFQRIVETCSREGISIEQWMDRELRRCGRHQDAEVLKAFILQGKP